MQTTIDIGIAELTRCEHEDGEIYCVWNGSGTNGEICRVWAGRGTFGKVMRVSPGVGCWRGKAAGWMGVTCGDMFLREDEPYATRDEAARALILNQIGPQS